LNKDTLFIEKQLENLNLLEQSIKEASYGNLALPSCKLRVSRSHGKHQYYTREANSNTWHYLPQSELEKARCIAQFEYDQQLLLEIKKLRYYLEHSSKDYSFSQLENLYNQLCVGRKELIDPRITLSEQAIRTWYTEHPGSQNPKEIETPYETERGEIVRSKSEKILADLFYHKGIPYQYETELILGTRKIYPDFILFHVRKRKSTFWEHLGLINDPSYCQYNFTRLDDYELNGFLVGRDVLFSMEATKHPLNMKLIEQKLEIWLNS